MLCVGETLEEREAGRTGEVVERQLAASLAELEDAQVAGIMLAYEPVWAIGTGRTATPADASEIHGVLRRALASRVGDKAAAGIPILYGGSVNRGNACGPRCGRLAGRRCLARRGQLGEHRARLTGRWAASPERRGKR